MTSDQIILLTKFQSMRSVRSATAVLTEASGGALISIHALREERNIYKHYDLQANSPISIHALREERNPHIPAIRPDAGISIHALREERN